MRILFIGGGNMASALVGGLLQRTWVRRSVFIARQEGLPRSGKWKQGLRDALGISILGVMLGVAVLTVAGWALFGGEHGLATGLVSAVAVVLVACPCALGLATPVSMVAGMGRGAQADAGQQGDPRQQVSAARARDKRATQEGNRVGQRHHRHEFCIHSPRNLQIHSEVIFELQFIEHGILIN